MTDLGNMLMHDGTPVISNRVKLTLRGKEFWVESIAVEPGLILALALLALEDERVEAVFKALNIKIGGYPSKDAPKQVCIWPEEPCSTKA